MRFSVRRIVAGFRTGLTGRPVSGRQSARAAADPVAV